MSLVFEKLTQAVVAGQAWRLNIAADFFRLEAAAWPVTVRLLRAGSIVGEMRNFQAGDYARGVPFDAVEIINGAQAQTLTVQIAGGGVGSDRVLGEVSVIDGAQALVAAGQAFAAQLSTSPVAGQYGVGVISNPAGSGVVVALDGLMWSHNSTGLMGVSVKRYVATVGTDQGANENRNLSGSAAQSVARRRSTTVATSPALAGASYFGVVSNPGDVVVAAQKHPILIHPGYAVGVEAWATNVSMYVNFEFREVPQ